MFRFFVLFFIALIFTCAAFAQEQDNAVDTFFLAKKAGLLGRLGRSLATNPEKSVRPVKSENRFRKYKGKIIRYIEIVPVGFNQSMNDTTEVSRNLAIRIANRFHKNSRKATIHKYLFFK